MNEVLQKLINCLDQYYNFNDLETLCLIFNIPVGNIIIHNEPIAKSVLRLIDHFSRNYGNVDALVEAVIKTRPQLPCVAELKNLYEESSQDVLFSITSPTGGKTLKGTPPGRIGVILVSDIEGSTEMLTSKSEIEFTELIKNHNAIIRERIEKHGGYEIRNQGDGFVIAFHTPKDGILFALDVQLAFVLWNVEHTFKHDQIRVRMGFHFGEINIEKGQPEGKTAIIATRISGLAQGEEIIVSETIKSFTEQELNINFQNFGTHSLKGLTEKYQLYKVDWKNCLKDSI